MAFTSEAFRLKIEELEQKHKDWFSRHPPLTNDDINCIHDHYYIYMNVQGHQLRFNAMSDLPIEIRNEIKEIFAETMNHAQ